MMRMLGPVVRCSGGGAKTQVNNGSKPLPFEFVSLYLRGKSDGFTLKGGDATKGTLDVQYDGPRPDPKIAGTCGKTGTYQPMRKRGAIILATGGDNSNSAMGKFCTNSGSFLEACTIQQLPKCLQCAHDCLRWYVAMYLQTRGTWSPASRPTRRTQRSRQILWPLST